MNSNEPVPRDGYISVRNADLYYREIGAGQPLLVLHGGPDFDHTYLLPEMDLLSDSYHLIYYDQRGRGKSVMRGEPHGVTIASEIQDIESLRDFFHLDSVALLGHSWGGVLALEYALRHPQRVSHLILLNTAPACHQDYMLLREERRKHSPEDIETLKAIYKTAGYQAGDPGTVADYYRVHFRATVRQPDQLEKVVERVSADFTPQAIFKARAIEAGLMQETWSSREYNLLPQLKRLDIPTLVLHGDYDFIPTACAEHIAQAIPGAQLRVLEDCGHFSFLECPNRVRREIDIFLVEARA